jgi:antitoxin component YwqK of YwqJK toxin-antitoxin module
MLLNGKDEDFYLNKSLKSSGLFNRGLRDGSWRNWDGKGNLVDDFS